MGINKITLGNKTLLDVSGVTATPEVVTSGYRFVNSNGELMTGLAKSYPKVITGTVDVTDPEKVVIPVTGISKVGAVFIMGKTGGYLNEDVFITCFYIHKDFSPDGKTVSLNHGKTDSGWVTPLDYHLTGNAVKNNKIEFNYYETNDYRFKGKYYYFILGE